MTSKPDSARGGLEQLLEAIDDVPEVRLDAGQAAKFVDLSLHCADREYPNKPGMVLVGDESLKPPRELTPAFYGCFDWHSAVHGHWAMIRVLKRFPEVPQAGAIRKMLNRHLSAAAIAGEVSCFELKRNRSFERPYGWGWLMRLATELHTWGDPDAKRWAANLQPLVTLLSQRTVSYLKRLSRPIRAGTHSNTAFALVHMLDYARAAGSSSLQENIEQAARRYYGDDTGCPTSYEPSGEDFISPCLAEADLMRRVLRRDEFQRWLGRFLPPVTSDAFAPLRIPPEIRDRRDPKIGHLIGLDFHRAWTMAGISGALPTADPRRPVFDRLSRLHCQEAIRQMFDSGYGGKHWLASFAIYHMTGVGR